MVKPAFENLDVDLWVHPGKLGLTQPSVCLFHNVQSVGAQLLDALTELTDDPCPAQRTITFRICSRELALQKLKLKLESVREDLKIMHVAHERETATITMTEEGLSLLRNALVNWLGGGEDFGVSPRRSTLKSKEFGKLDKESGELWFWGPGYSGP